MNCSRKQYLTILENVRNEVVELKIITTFFKKIYYYYENI